MKMRLLSWLLLVLISACSLPAFAQEGGDESSPQKLTKEQQELVVNLVEKGKTDYNAGEFTKALEHFKEAYDIFPHPDLLYRIGLCHERLGEDKEALAYYRRFVVEAPPTEERARVEKMIPVIANRVSKSKLVIRTDPPNALVYFGNEPEKVKGHTEANLAVGPGEYHVIIRKEGYQPVEEMVSVDSGETVTLSYQLKKDESSAAEAGVADSTDSGSSVSASAVILTAVGGGAAITSAVFFSLYADRQAELDTLDNRRTEVSRANYNEVESERNIYLGVALGTGVGAMVCLVWAYIEWNEASTPSTTALAPPMPASAPALGWTEDGPTVGWRLRF